MTHPWAYARPLTVGERLRVLKDWAALDPWGLQAVAVQVQGDFDAAVDKIVADLDPWPEWSNATHRDSPLAVASRRARPWPEPHAVLTYMDGRRKVVPLRGGRP